MRQPLIRIGLAAAAAGLVVCGAQPGRAASPRCVAIPHSCGYPDATDTGVPAGMTLRSVPGQVASGPGWHFNPVTREVDVTGSGALLSGLSIPYTVNVTASRVTIKDVRVVHSGFFGISLRHTAGVIIEHSTIRGTNTGTGRLGSAICDLYGDSYGLIVAFNNISAAKTAVQLSAGVVTTNYIHDFGYLPGDHLNGVLDLGTTQPLTVYRNTILNGRDQTDAVSIDAAAGGQHVAHKAIVGNLLAGGSFTVYGGAGHGNATSDVTIEDNRFSTVFFPKGGRYAPVAYFASHDRGNGWSGNVWDGTGNPVPAP